MITGTATITVMATITTMRTATDTTTTDTATTDTATKTTTDRLRRALRAAALAGASVAALAVVATALCNRRAEGRFAFQPSGTFTAARISADGVELRYLAAGEGAVVVFLHGAYGGAEDALATFGPDLARDHRVVAFDRPGHGYSGRDGARHRDPVGQGRTILAALDAMALDRVTLVGFSFGGAVAASMASEQPERFHSVVLIAAPLLPWGGAAGAVDRVLSVPFLGPALAWTGGSLAARGLAPAQLADAFAPEQVTSEYAQSPTALAVRPGSLVANSEDLDGLSAELGEQRARYGRLQLPITLVHGTADPIVWYDHHAEPLSEELADARLILLEGAGHQLLYTRTADVLAAIRGRTALGSVR